MRSAMKYIAFILMLLGFDEANVGQSMTNFFNKFGVNSNFTGPKVMEDQSAGYFTGGGSSISNGVMEIKPAHVEMPSLRYGGCGDIDLYLGGFSFISGSQIVDAMKKTASSAMGYAFMLSLETVSPQFANTVKQMQSWANQINTFGINSCEAGANITSALWPRQQQASHAICRSQGSGNGMMADYISARHGCAEQGTYDRSKEKAEKDTPSLFNDEFNIAWKVIYDDQLFESNDLRHLLMSVSGTLVGRKTDGGKFQTEYFESKVMSGEFMKKLMEGGDVPVYVCRDTGGNSKCLFVKESTIKIDANLALKNRVQKILTSMQRKIKTNQAFSEEEKALLNKTRLPLLRMFNVMTAYGHGSVPLSLPEYADLVAIDMVCLYLRNILDTIRANITRKMQIQFDSGLLERYENSLVRVEARVKEYETSVEKRMSQLYMLEKKMRLMEQDIYNEVETSVEK